ncbi:hypothetical protein PR003_g2501 [Phytophthora rubi]|uniref:Uncharacterized protein n=1 Tax=Phytophthora rubi TaxID=129364 RepID=A0A6A3P4X9_9STRA|nr:hypothetical protein PR002_g334 [Phytophthora rubi]KAE9356088.1 hypothetical protein PR003_g2501 [Phytophthora rubi]
MMTSDQYEVIYTLRSELAKKGFGRFGCRRSWLKDVTPAEREVFMKYRKKGARRAAVGGLFGALAMASVWKIAALGTAFGVTGVIVGGLVGAWMSMRASRIRLKMVKEMINLPTDKSPHAAEAREILRRKLPSNPYAQKLLKEAELASDWKQEKAAPESSKDK